MPEHSWSYQTIEMTPSSMGSFDIGTLNKVLAREGHKDWKLVSMRNAGLMRSIYLFLKKPR